MTFLKCKICGGEIDIIDDNSITKKIKCNFCGFSNEDSAKKMPEVIVIKKRKPVMD